MPRSQRTFQRRTGSRPNLAWSSSLVAVPTVVPTVTKVLVASLVLSNTNIDETLLRVVGGLALQSDQVAANEDQVGAFGMIVVTSQALAAGVASMPGPFTDGASDWFMYQPLLATITVLTAVGIEAQMATYFAINNKAKRIVSEGYAIALIAENGGTNGFRLTHNLRVLSMVRGTR